MALGWGQQVGGPIPPSFGSKRIQPTSRTFLATCVDEARERREDPWNPARLHRERVERELNDIKQQLAALAAPRVRSKATTKPCSLTPALRNILQILKAMPPEDFDSLQNKEIIARVMAKIIAEYGGVGRAPSTIKEGLAYFRHGKLPRRGRP
jgi:hypothetical protein